MTHKLNKVALVGFAGKGPINEPVKVNKSSIFGFPNPETNNNYMLYAAEQVLGFVDEVFIYRAADPHLVRTASIPIPGVNNLIKTYSKVKSPYIFKTNQFFRWKLNGVLSGKTLVVLATDDEGISASQLAEELNDQLSVKDGIKFFDQDNYIGVRTTNASNLELISVQDAIYGPWGVTGLGVYMKPAEKKGTVKGPFSTYGILQLVVRGSGNLAIDGTTQTINLEPLEKECTVEDVVEFINKNELPLLPGGWKAYVDNECLAFKTTHAGSDASIKIKPSRLASVFGFTSEEARGKSPNEGTIFFGSSSETDEISMTVEAESPGTAGNSTRVVIVNDPDCETFTINVYHDGLQVESWRNLTKNEKSKFYVESFINLFSEWIRVKNHSAIPPKSGSYLLGDEKIAGIVHGCDGIPYENDKLLKQGVYAFVDHDIDLLAVPGVFSQEVIGAMVDVCENIKKNCLPVIDPPMEMNDEEVSGWANSFNSKDGILAYPWVKIRDTYNKRNVWVPPSGSVITAIVRSDALSAPWFPPTGTTRGLIPGILDVFSQQKESSGNINLITNYVGDDSFALMGQKTLGGNDINFRRLLFYIEKTIRSTINRLGYNEIQACEYVLEQVKNGRGIYKYTIDVLERDETLQARIGVQPRNGSVFEYLVLKLRQKESGNIN